MTATIRYTTSRDPVCETATSRLRAEHQLILQVTEVLETLVARSESGDTDSYALADCIAFIRLFADTCHHGKEENLLFPALEARGMPHDQGPIFDQSPAPSSQLPAHSP